MLKFEFEKIWKIMFLSLKLKYGSNLSIVIRSPRASRIAASDADVIPFPREDTTPPVMNIYRVIQSISLSQATEILLQQMDSHLTRSER